MPANPVYDRAPFYRTEVQEVKMSSSNVVDEQRVNGHFEETPTVSVIKKYLVFADGSTSAPLYYDKTGDVLLSVQTGTFIPVPVDVGI